ncbi:DEAD/DEAH box helicase [Dysgonomonas sp. Marseille-P4361]|uniref:DEAD/DEAH box helicase n=1 Tax=Dysgonomonas sp. Marseille-P4361 TaxID=2161820 RepID=UPI000D5559DA|nr:DEAD/DEAH box helicase [Dysgonomonas sp. Marseille-P4361]
MQISQSHIDTYKSLFRGRDDVYAVRWEKDGRSGYMPAYKVDWDDYNKHKASGGTFASYTKKEYLPFNDVALREHFAGKTTVGIYPLLQDNTSFFIAADFDEENWQESIFKLHKACLEVELPAYIERSRSGSGGHLWLFFEENIPAFQSRKIMFELLLQSGIISKFEKEPSFDRLFPNQDIHSGKGIGNLIALPLQGNSLVQGNSCFIEPDTLTPIDNQWTFLETVKKIPKQKIDSLHLLLSGKTKEVFTSKYTNSKSAFELEILINSEIYLKRIQLNQKLIDFLRNNLNFLNSDYIVKKRLGKTAYNIEKYFKLIEETTEGIIIPRGFASSLVKFCNSENIPIKIIDERCRQEEITVNSKIDLLPHQQEVLERAETKDFGVIVSPPGSGKTIIGLELISQKKQPTLILVHRKQLFDQWIDRIQNFLSIPKKQIGQIGNQKDKIGKEVTIAMIQSLTRGDLSELKNRFGMVIVDECHHIPAKSFREVITQLNCYYLYGLTATPKRKNNDEKLIYVYIGNIIYEMTQKELLEQQNSKAEINIKETELFVPFDYKTDNYETVSQVLIYDTARNGLILKDIDENISRFKSILILTERKSHVNILNLYLKEKYETIAISGDDSERSRKSKLEQIEQGHFQIIISTGQYFGEGIDISALECLFIVYPFTFEGKLVQYIGRVQRSGKPPVIFDYRDSKIDYFDKMFKQRNRYYNKLRK